MPLQGNIPVRANSLGRFDGTDTAISAAATIALPGQDQKVFMRVGDRVLIAGSMGCQHATSTGGGSCDILITRPDGSTENILGSGMRQTVGGGGFNSMVVGPVMKGADQGEGVYRFQLRATNQSGAGDLDIVNNCFLVLPLIDQAGAQAKNASSGSQGSSLAPMGAGQSVLDDRGPFAPAVP